MNTFMLQIASPDGNIFGGEVVSIMLRGTSGDLAILAGHIPFTTAVKECDVVVTFADDTQKTGHTLGGLLAVSKEKTTLLSGSFRWNE